MMEEDWKPRIGMEFDNVEVAWNFWIIYGGKMGFGVRKDSHVRSKKDRTTITSIKFVCSKEGFRGPDKRDKNTKNPRGVTRTGCQARLGLKLVGTKYQVYQFIEQHNHELHTLETSHMLRLQRRISEVQTHEIELAEDSGLRQKTSFDLLSLHAGERENLGYTRMDVNSCLKSRRQRNMVYGEAGVLLKYFQNQLIENPLFFHAYQMDFEEHITNVFWADARMIVDYGLFGDVVSFDTTFVTNKNNRPLVLFCGFNHHRGMVIFGAGLLYDETVASFSWLFQTFLEAHRHKKPSTIFTDQDVAMARALSEVMPDTVHRLCTWYLMQNAAKFLACLPREESLILRELSRCMYEIDDEDQFEAAWCKLLLEHNVGDNQWLTTMYQLREKWAACFMKKSLTLGMGNIQLSESLNLDLKNLLNPNLDLVQFFKHFEKIVDDKRYNELKCEYECREKIPQLRISKCPMLRQLSTIYTSAIFELFQREYDDVRETCIKEKSESQPMLQYVISLINSERVYIVSFDPFSTVVTCSCGKFENLGILCCHALKVYDHNDVKLVPDRYILPRWTMKARTGIICDIREKEIEEDPGRGSTNRFTELSRDMISLAAEASKSEEASSALRKFAFEFRNQFCEFHSTGQGLSAYPSAAAVPSHQFT